VDAANEAERRAEEEPAPREATGADFIIPALSVALVIYYSTSTLGMAWEAKVTGVVIGAILIPLCLVHMARMVGAIAAGRGTFGLDHLVDNNLLNRQRLGLVALVAAFIAGLDWIGIVPALFLLLVGCMLVMGVRSVRALLGVSLVATAVVYLLLIYFLNSRLPQGPVEKLLGSVLAG
jgi:hypothetical protein